MVTLLDLSGLVFSAGWMISGILFTLQFVRLVRTNEIKDIYWVTFLGFAILNANAGLYGYLTDNMWWLPGTGLSAVACALIAWKAYWHPAGSA